MKKLPDIYCQHVNHSMLRVHFKDADTELSFYDYFTFTTKNKYQKKKGWDGRTRLYNKRTKMIYAGLWMDIKKWAEKYRYSIVFDEEITKKTDVDFKELIKFIKYEIAPTNEKGQPLTPYDYQLETVYHCINHNRATILAATSSGKSLSIYMLARFYQMMLEDHKHIMIVVPTKALVEQLYVNFEEFSSKSEWIASMNVKKINSDYDRNKSRQILITTYQSIMDLSEDWFSDIGAVMVDETHLASAKSFKKILQNCSNTKYRFGFTGTLDNVELNKLVIKGLLGPIKRVVKTKELQDAGRASQLEVQMHVLDYPDDVKQTMKGARYVDEMEYLCSSGIRNDYILETIKGLKGNTLILSDRVESHLEPLYELYKTYHPNTHIITKTGKYAGTTEEHEAIRQMVETVNDAVVFATYQTCSTGISIKRLHNVMIIYSTKSIIRTLQTIGRALRLHKTKHTAKFIDIVDNLKVNKGAKPNYSLSQAMERAKFYRDDEFKVRMVPVKLTHTSGEDVSLV